MKLFANFRLGCGGIILLIIAAIIVAGMIVYFNTDNWIARSPNRICKEVGLKLPSYTVLEEGNNMDRDASSWSWYSWRIKLKKPLSEKDIHKLERLVKEDPNWQGSRYGGFIYKNYKEYGEEGYLVEYDTFISPQIYIIIYPDNEISIKYTWDDFFF